MLDANIPPIQGDFILLSKDPETIKAIEEAITIEDEELKVFILMLLKNSKSQTQIRSEMEDIASSQEVEETMNKIWTAIVKLGLHKANRTTSQTSAVAAGDGNRNVTGRKNTTRSPLLDHALRESTRVDCASGVNSSGTHQSTSSGISVTQRTSPMGVAAASSTSSTSSNNRRKRNIEIVGAGGGGGGGGGGRNGGYHEQQQQQQQHRDNDEEAPKSITSFAIKRVRTAESSSSSTATALDMSRPISRVEIPLSSSFSKNQEDYAEEEGGGGDSSQVGGGGGGGESWSEAYRGRGGRGGRGTSRGGRGRGGLIHPQMMVPSAQFMAIMMQQQQQMMFAAAAAAAASRGGRGGMMGRGRGGPAAMFGMRSPSAADGTSNDRYFPPGGYNETDHTVPPRTTSWSSSTPTTSAAATTTSSASMSYVNKSLIACKFGPSCFRVTCEYKHPEKPAVLAPHKSTKFGPTAAAPPPPTENPQQ